MEWAWAHLAMVEDEGGKPALVGGGRVKVGWEGDGGRGRRGLLTWQYRVEVEHGACVGPLDDPWSPHVVTLQARRGSKMNP